MNQAQLLFDTQYPNARRHLVRDCVCWLSGLRHEIQTAASVERDTSGLRGKVILSLLIMMFFLLPTLAYLFDPSPGMIAIWMFYSWGLLIMARAKLIYEPLKNIKLIAIASMPPVERAADCYQTLHRTLPVDLPPPR